VLHQDENRHRAYALKWVGAEPGRLRYLGSLALNRARTGEFFDVRSRRGSCRRECFLRPMWDCNIGLGPGGADADSQGLGRLLPVPVASQVLLGRLPCMIELRRCNPASHFSVTHHTRCRAIIRTPSVTSGLPG